mmetsp:Transcript_27556/g.88590  ORF Transcript_27556/g.88590 Transcript_27556/m.88590 type:complete len:220 (+) Transcript_27556:719-1378(+)
MGHRTDAIAAPTSLRLVAPPPRPAHSSARRLHPCAFHPWVPRVAPPPLARRGSAAPAAPRPPPARPGRRPAPRLPRPSGGAPPRPQRRGSRLGPVAATDGAGTTAGEPGAAMWAAAGAARAAGAGRGAGVRRARRSSLLGGQVPSPAAPLWRAASGCSRPPARRPTPQRTALRAAAPASTVTVCAVGGAPRFARARSAPAAEVGRRAPSAGGGEAALWR